MGLFSGSKIYKKDGHTPDELINRELKHDFAHGGLKDVSKKEIDAFSSKIKEKFGDRSVSKYELEKFIKNSEHSRKFSGIFEKGDVSEIKRELSEDDSGGHR